MRMSILSLLSFQAARLRSIKSYVRFLRPCPELSPTWGHVSPDTCSCMYSVHHYYGSVVSVPLNKTCTPQRHGLCPTHLSSSVLSTGPGLESMLRKYLIEGCVKRWGTVESRRSILKTCCNYSRNWLIIIRPLALRPKTNKKIKC